MADDMADDINLVQPEGVDEPVHHDARGSKWTRRVSFAVVGLIIYVLGVATGSAGSSDSTEDPGPAAFADPAPIESGLADRETELDKRSAEIAAEAEAVAEMEASLDARSAQLDAREVKLDERKSNLDHRESGLDQREEALDDADTGPDDMTGFLDPGEAVHYENCSEARVAGVTPLAVGDPGYDGHLDRDGDGVACE